MTALLLASALLAGTPCRIVVGSHVFHNGYGAQQAVVHDAGYFVAPYHTVGFQHSYIGLAARSEEGAQQLLIIEQQSKAFARANEGLLGRLERQDQVIEQKDLQLAALLQQEPAPNPARAAPAAGGALPLFQTRCGSCHAGAQGKTHGWVLDEAKLARPSVKLRLRIENAVSRKDKPMPKDGKLSEAELAIFRQWWKITPAELVESD